MQRRATDLRKCRALHPEKRVLPHGRQRELPLGQRPALQVGHLVDGHFRVLAAVIVKEPHRLGRVLPHVEQRQALFAEQPDDVMPPVAREHRIIGVEARMAQIGDDRRIAREIGQPDRSRFPHGPGKAAVWQIDKAHGLAARGDVGHQFQRCGVEDAHAARLVIRDRHQRTIVRDRAADGIAGLHDAGLDAALQHVHLRQPAVAAKDIGMTLVGREGHRGVAEIAQAIDARKGFMRHPVHQQDRPGGALDDQAQSASGAGLGGRGGHGQHQQGKRCGGKETDHCAGSLRRYSAIHSASASVRSARQGGMAVPGIPSRMIAASASGAAWASASRVNGLPSPPLRTSP